MKDKKKLFDYCIGNPPYQETKGGTKNVDVWQHFVKESTTIATNSCMIHPGRWVIPKKSKVNIRTDLLSNGLKSFIYIPKSSDTFNNVAIDGGLTITLFKQDYTGDISYRINNNGELKVFDVNDKLFTNQFEEEAYTKVFTDIKATMSNYIKGFVGTLGYSDRFNFLDDESLSTVKDTSDGMKEPIKVWCTKTTGKGHAKYKWYYIEKSNIKNIADYQFTSRKVMLDKKGNAIAHGKGNVINNLPQITDKYSYGVNVLWVIPKNDRERELYLLKSLFMTKTARYLMCITQKDLYVRGFENIPDYLELAKLLPKNELFTDEWFYKTFNFSNELINEIETRVSEKVEK